MEVHGQIFGVRACDLGFVYLEVDEIVTVLMQAMVIRGLELYILLGFSLLFFFFRKRVGGTHNLTFRVAREEERFGV